MSSTTLEALPSSDPADVVRARERRRRLGFAAFAVLAVVAVLLWHEIPSWLDIHVQSWMQDRYKWTVYNRETSPVFTWFLNPASDLLTWSVDKVHWVLSTLRWPGVVVLGGVIGWRTGGVRAGVAACAALLGVGIVSDWALAMLTLSIMTVAVVIALVIGVPLGILTSRSDRAEKIVRIILDTAQVMPAFVYFSPLQVAFGLQVPPAVMATVVYALPPAVRLTNLGLRQVPVVANEVGVSFGATEWQRLVKVQLPMARRSILLGLNQVIMMAFAIVVLASLLGTGDLGQSVLSALQKQEVGKAMAAGLGIVLLAVALDRMTTGQRTAALTIDRRVVVAAGLGAVVLAAVVAKVVELTVFPESLRWDISGSVDSAVGWVQDNLRRDVPIIGGTQSISDFLVIRILDPIKELLLWLPWLLVVVLFAFIGWLSKGWRLAGTVAVCLLLIGVLGGIPGGTGTVPMWDLAMDTLSQVLVAIVISVLIALPLGILAGRSDRVDAALRPFLDIAQVLPQFVYLLPVVFLFSVGRAAGVVACVIYAVPPCIRLTALGMREVPWAPREAAISFGATRRQEMRMVQLPLARRAILLGINQTLMMVLATVIIAALVGAGALGLVAYEATAKPLIKLGQGVGGGVSIVLLAIMLDRITQAWGRDTTSPQGGKQ
ncbi:MAG: Glycine betaine transport system permease protein OpuAB [Actinomycetota bacterium]